MAFISNSYYFLLLLLSSIASNVFALTLELTPNIYHFNYEEFSTTDRSLNTEKGFLPGIKFKVSQRHKNNTYIAYASIHDGTVDYTGGTQSGQPHTTDTNQQLLQLGFELISQPMASIPGQLIFGLRHWEWDRDILDNNGIMGLHEIYTWSEISLGLNFRTENKNSSYLWANISALYTLNPDIEIYLENSQVTLNMQEKPGVRFHTGKTWANNTQHHYKLSFIAEYWEFGRSNTAFTDDFFGSSVFITEPRSESFHTGLEFSYVYLF